MSILGEPIILGNSGELSSYYTIEDDNIITDLTNTTWYFNSTVNVQTDFVYNIIFETTVYGWPINCTLIKVDSNILYYDADIGVSDGQTWYTDDARTITFVNGTDVNNLDLIAWLYENATLQSTIPFTRIITPHPSVPVIENVKMYTVSQNGSYSILPDNGVSAFQNASINVNINDVYLSKIIDKTVSDTYENSTLTTIGSYAFYSCSNLMSVAFLNCTTIGVYAFYDCSNLTTASFPKCITIGTSTFQNCYSLITISFPNCTSIGNYAFRYCYSLTTVSFPNCEIIEDTDVFGYCYNLISLYLMSTSICTLGNSKAFTSTPIAGYTTSTGGIYGSIYVPSSLLSSYKTATNWSYFSSRFVGI